PIQAGLAFLPLTASMLVVNLWFTPRLMKRHAPRALIAAGVVVAVPGLLWLTVVDGGSFAVAVLVPTIMIGIGGGVMNTPLATLVQRLSVQATASAKPAHRRQPETAKTTRRAS